MLVHKSVGLFGVALLECCYVSRFSVKSPWTAFVLAWNIYTRLIVCSCVCVTVAAWIITMRKTTIFFFFFHFFVALTSPSLGLHDWNRACMILICLYNYTCFLEYYWVFVYGWVSEDMLTRLNMYAFHDSEFSPIKPWVFTPLWLTVSACITECIHNSACIAECFYAVPVPVWVSVCMFVRIIPWRVVCMTVSACNTVTTIKCSYSRVLEPS